MKPKTVARLLVFGVVPAGWLCVWLVNRYLRFTPAELVFVLGWFAGTGYSSGAVLLIEWSARRARKAESRKLFERLSSK